MHLGIHCPTDATKNVNTERFIFTFELLECFKFSFLQLTKTLWNLRISIGVERGSGQLKLADTSAPLFCPNPKFLMCKRDREVGGEVRLKGSHRKKKKSGVAMQLRVSCRHGPGTLGCAATTPEPHVCAVLLRHSLQLSRSQRLPQSVMADSCLQLTAAY